MQPERLEILERELLTLREESRRAARRARTAWVLALTLFPAAFVMSLYRPVEAQGNSQAGGVPALEKRVKELEQQVAALQQGQPDLLAAAKAYTDQKIAAEAAARQAADTALQAAVGAIEGTIQPFFSFVSVDGTDVIFTGANLHLRNGLGATNGNPADVAAVEEADTAVNGLGNLIIGYNENPANFERTGSHNLVVGAVHGWTSFGGIAAGYTNRIGGAYASVTGGRGNWAGGAYSSVSGGVFGSASGAGASVSGGSSNHATGGISWVGGGIANSAGGGLSSVVGGFQNSAAGIYSAISGGFRNVASGSTSCVSGGGENTASGTGSSISGGHMIEQPNHWGWSAGGDYHPGTGPGVFHAP
jgi:hypothetical protein